MKLSELVPGERYAFITRDSSWREGFPTCDEVTYIGREFPGLEVGNKKIVINRSYYRNTCTLSAVPPKKLWCSWQEYQARMEKYDEEEVKRTEANNKSVSYLTEQLELMYSPDQVLFEPQRGTFTVHPDTMAAMHNLPKPAGAWVWSPGAKKRIKR